MRRLALSPPLPPSHTRVQQTHTGNNFPFLSLPPVFITSLKRSLEHFLLLALGLLPLLLLPPLRNSQSLHNLLVLRIALERCPQVVQGVRVPLESHKGPASAVGGLGVAFPPAQADAGGSVRKSPLVLLELQVAHREIVVRRDLERRYLILDVLAVDLDVVVLGLPPLLGSHGRNETLHLRVRPVQAVDVQKNLLVGLDGGEVLAGGKGRVAGVLQGLRVRYLLGDGSGEGGGS
mmetsp:Transcript_18507/g.37065  ORF Transcript_18507/g.37065 Transcript_18507/m.37065 type:complete len:234 (-) Transcript_18507:103-804(-)